VPAVNEVWGRRTWDGHGSVLVLAVLRDFVVVRPWDREAGAFAGLENVPQWQFREYWRLSP
jgi:hypothetical protein